MKLFPITALTALLLTGSVEAQAEGQTNLVVPNCGQQNYNINQFGALTMLPNGTPCGATVTISGAVTISPGATIGINNGTPVALDALTLSGSGATTVLNAGHAAHGGWVSATVAYCINYVGTAGSVNNTPSGTSCGAGSGFAAGQPFYLPATTNAISMYGLASGVAFGTGQQ